MVGDILSVLDNHKNLFLVGSFKGKMNYYFLICGHVKYHIH